MADIRTVDIIIPTYRPGERFIRLLSMLEKQTYPYHRLIVINTCEELMPDSVKKMLGGMRDVMLKNISKEEFDHAGTRRAAVEMSDADLFLCMTDDAVPADIFLIGQLVSAMQDPDAALAYARQLPETFTSESEKYTRSFNYPAKNRKKTIDNLPELGIKTFFASNVCCIYDRKIYERLGGFVREAIFNEDMIYASAALRSGYASVYRSDARVIHAHDYTAMQQFHRNFDLGMSQAMHPEVFGRIRSEGEGIRLVRQTAEHLISNGHATEVPGLVWRSGWKYLGYRLGKSYRKLPRGLVRRFAMNRTFIDRMDRKD